MFEPNCPTHHMHFGNLDQTPNKSIKTYLVRLKSAALNCEFSCPKCYYDLVHINLKDQFIHSSDILAKASYLTTLEEIVKHTEAFENTLHDHSKLNEIANPSISHISDYHLQCQNSLIKPQCLCPGHGSTSHSAPGSNNWLSKCLAWLKNCLNCNIPNHFARVCCKEKWTLTVQIPSLLTCITIQLKTPT